MNPTEPHRPRHPLRALRVVGADDAWGGCGKPLREARELTAISGADGAGDADGRCVKTLMYLNRKRNHFTQLRKDCEWALKLHTARVLGLPEGHMIPLTQPGSEEALA